MASVGVLQVTLLVTHVLEELGVRYVIGGSLASIVHGMPRTTMDVDILADLKAEHVESFVSSLQDVFYVNKQVVAQSIERTSSFNMIHLQTMFKVDVFIRQERPFDEQQLNRRISELIDPNSTERIWILSPEDVVLAKLDWFRLGGETSERQWRDILGVLKTQRKVIDVAYLKKWAQTLTIADLMDRALTELELS